MRIVRVETCPGDKGTEAIRRFGFGRRMFDVTENVDQWHGEGYSYFKVKASDSNLYILRFDEARAEWDLTMFKAHQVGRLSRVFH